MRKVRRKRHGFKVYVIINFICYLALANSSDPSSRLQEQMEPNPDCHLSAACQVAGQERVASVNVTTSDTDAVVDMITSPQPEGPQEIIKDNGNTTNVDDSLLQQLNGPDASDHGNCEDGHCDCEDGQVLNDAASDTCYSVGDHEPSDAITVQGPNDHASSDDNGRWASINDHANSLIDDTAMLTFKDETFRGTVAVKHVGISQKINRKLGSFFVSCLSEPHDILLLSSFKDNEGRLLIGVYVIANDPVLGIKSKPCFVFTSNKIFFNVETFSSSTVNPDDFIVEESILQVYERLKAVSITENLNHVWKDNDDNVSNLIIV